MYRIIKLVEAKTSVFHAQDLAQLWGISNQNTLYTTLARYTKSGALYRIQKGLYSTIPVERIDPWLLGLKAVHHYAYVSTESIVAREGMLFQHSDVITLVSSASMRFTLCGYRYWVRQLTDRFLFNPAGIEVKDGVRQASGPRALADLLYFNPKMHIDYSTVSKTKLCTMQKEVGYV